MPMNSMNSISLATDFWQFAGTPGVPQDWIEWLLTPTEPL